MKLGRIASMLSNIGFDFYNVRNSILVSYIHITVKWRVTQGLEPLMFFVAILQRLLLFMEIRFQQMVEVVFVCPKLQG